MKSTDDRANDEADRHAQMMQMQRKPKQIGTIGATDAKRVPPAYLATVALTWHKTGTDYEK
ncbi:MULTISPECIES: hypothetical protein [unclassified Psychrobacter]|uniref:hypothetical protein n=1 Tax=unclassified Psychrobacter TaxID=196806 RepID=UPI0025F75800|nr:MULTISPECIES: hypothetical protein [unclassified Psychrobacter]